MSTAATSARPSSPLARAPSVAIVTALAHEAVAVETVFGFPKPQPLPNSRTSRLAQYAEVPVVSGGTVSVVALQLLDMGNNTAAAMTAELLAAHPSIKHLIMCGIAGAVPHPKKPERHVRLGDVVVSNRNGIVQYDLVKQEVGFTERRFPPRPPSAALLQCVRRLHALELQGKRVWEQFTKAAVAARGKEWRRPPAALDMLDDGGRAIPHPADPARRRDQPRVFHGPIASANVLLKDPKLRDLLREQYGVMAAEMEGSGVADAGWLEDAGYLVVRGTCDYCNPAKGDTWQKYAAVIAAAFTRAVVEQLPADENASLASRSRRGRGRTSKSHSQQEWLLASIPLTDETRGYVELVLQHLEDALAIKLHRTYSAQVEIRELPPRVNTPRGDAVDGDNDQMVSEWRVLENGGDVSLPPPLALACYGTTFQTVAVLVRRGRERLTGFEGEVAVTPWPTQAPLVVSFRFSDGLTCSAVVRPEDRPAGAAPVTPPFTQDCLSRLEGPINVTLSLGAADE